MMTKTTLIKMAQELEAINRSMKRFDFNEFEIVNRVAEEARRQQLEISRFFEASKEAARMQEFIGANQHFLNLIKEATAATSHTEEIASAHRSWLEDHTKHFRMALSVNSHVQRSAKLSLCNTTLRLAATGSLMRDIHLESISSRFQIKKSVISNLERSITDVAVSYRSLAESFRRIPDVTRLPKFVLPGATREVYTTNFALKTLTPSGEQDEEDAKTEFQIVNKIQDETSNCISLLKQVDRELLRLYTGAHEALHGNNSDKARHILVSLRELWSHLLKRLAPDNLVLSWVQVQGYSGNGLLHDGKPTRKARVLYVCRELSNDTLSDFLISDTQALVKLIDLFNRLHKPDTKLTTKELKAILLKSDSWLMFMLQISKEEI